jgi:hypothetical protein
MLTVCVFFVNVSQLVIVFIGNKTWRFIMIVFTVGQMQQEGDVVNATPTFLCTNVEHISWLSALSQAASAASVVFTLLRYYSILLCQ